MAMGNGKTVLHAECAYTWLTCSRWPLNLLLTFFYAQYSLSDLLATFNHRVRFFDIFQCVACNDRYL